MLISDLWSNPFDYKTIVSHFNQYIQKHVTGILSFPISILNSKECLAFVKLEKIISELQTVEYLKAVGFFEAGQRKNDQG